MKGGLRAKFIEDYEKQTIIVKMNGNNYCFESARKAINQVKHLKYQTSPYYYMKQKVINNVWSSGVVLKIIDFRRNMTDYKTVSYESLYKKNASDEEDPQIRTSILRLFYNLRDLTKTEFSPILVQHIGLTGYRFGGGPRTTESPTIVSDDYRRTILSVAVTELKPDGFFDEHFILKISSHEDRIQGYRDEALIYDKLGLNPNVVRYYGSGNYRYVDGASLNILDKITFSKEQWSSVFKDTQVLENEGFYILLENTLGYYDYEDYVKIKLEKCFSSSFVKIFNTLKEIKSKSAFFHGDLHNNNVKINKSLHVKLFDFDYSGILGIKGHISKNFQNYKLKYNGLLLNLNNMVKTDDLQNFLFWFDVFRLWLSTSKSLQKVLKINSSGDPKLYHMISVYYQWFQKMYDKQWHDYFMGDYFFVNIYSKSRSRSHAPETVAENEFIDLDNSSIDSKTLVIGDKSYSIKISDSQLSNGSILIDGDNPEFVLANSADLKSLVIGGNTPKYRKHGKNDVIINNVKLKMRVVWKHNRKFFIKRRDGHFEQISKKSIQA